MSPFDIAMLFAAGVLGGVMNSIAGGGSFVTFPALMLSGVPPIMANASNTFASTAGYISGAYAFRQDIARDKTNLGKIILLSILGGAIGAWCLLQVQEQTFLQVIPWLMLFATVMFVIGGRLNLALGRFSGKGVSKVVGPLLALGLLVVSVYGGFFNAGLGIISLSYLVLAGYQDINVMNGVKLLISCGVSATAIVIFVANGAIDWLPTCMVLLGTLVGGYYAADVSRRLPQVWVRRTVTLISIIITAYFFYDTYAIQVNRP